MKFACLYVDRYLEGWRNIGEDMMIFATMNLYKHMGIDEAEIVRLPQSQLRSYDGEDLILPLNFPFFGNFKMSPKIHPVFIAISVIHSSVVDSMGLKEYEPIGCRDLYSYRVLKQAGVDAYVNGCMTITLPKRELGADRKKVYFIDIPEKLRPFIPEELLKDAVFDSQVFFGDEAYNADEKFTDARYMEYIREAKLVVSSRLHCVVPCAAAGIPTVAVCEKKSFRFDWLDNIMPVYSEKEFADINWDPKPIEFEAEKKLILDHAASRVWAEYHKWTSRPKIFRIYNNDRTDYLPDSAGETYDYLKKTWGKGTGHKYVLWGVTQTAYVIYDHISEHYPDAELSAVIDVFNKQSFHGMETCGLDFLEKNRDCTVFVTAEAANAEAIALFSKLNITDYIICWNNPRTQKR